MAYDSKYYREPLACCCGEDCFDVASRPYTNSERATYQNDIDFKEFDTAIFGLRCKIDYHVSCFKILKERTHRTNNQQFIGNDCITPGCGGQVRKGMVFKKNGEQTLLSSDKLKHKRK